MFRNTKELDWRADALKRTCLSFLSEKRLESITHSDATQTQGMLKAKMSAKDHGQSSNVETTSTFTNDHPTFPDETFEALIKNVKPEVQFVARVAYYDDDQAFDRPSPHRQPHPGEVAQIIDVVERYIRVKQSMNELETAQSKYELSVDDVFEDFVSKSAPELSTMLRRRYYARHYEILFPQPVPDKIDESCLTGGGRNSGLSSSVPWDYFERVEKLMSEFKTTYPNRIARFRT